MRVRGNGSPAVIHLEPYHPMPGYVELRICENDKAVTYFDETVGKEITMHEYDEYVFLLKDKEGLREEVEANLSNWLITGRTLEVNDAASTVQDMKEALEILGVKTNEN